MKAAALLHSIVRYRALLDGNDRLPWLSCVVFCDVNGVAVALEDGDAFDLVMQAAQGELDVEDIAARLPISTRPNSGGATMGSSRTVSRFTADIAAQLLPVGRCPRLPTRVAWRAPAAANAGGRAGRATSQRG